jgi:cyclic pyranopterin phosphate synthase
MDVKGLLRGPEPETAVAAAIRENLRRKWIGHQIGKDQFVAPPRPMYAIGG